VRHLKDLCEEFLEKLEKQRAEAQTNGATVSECPPDAQKQA